MSGHQWFLVVCQINLFLAGMNASAAVCNLLDGRTAYWTGLFAGVCGVYGVVGLYPVVFP